MPSVAVHREGKRSRIWGLASVCLSLDPHPVGQFPLHITCFSLSLIMIIFFPGRRRQVMGEAEASSGPFMRERAKAGFWEGGGLVDRSSPFKFRCTIPQSHFNALREEKKKHQRERWLDA